MDHHTPIVVTHKLLDRLTSATDGDNPTDCQVNVKQSLTQLLHR